MAGWPHWAAPIVRAVVGSGSGGENSPTNPVYTAPATGGGSQAVTIADGADVALGATTDAAVSTDANGTVNAHTRGIVALLVNLLSRWPAALVGGRLDVNVGADPSFAAVAGGTKVGATTSATQLASTPCRLIRVKADIANTGLVYLGPSGATTAGANAYTQLAAGDDTGWIPISNANLLYHIASAGTQNFFWMAL